MTDQKVYKVIDKHIAMYGCGPTAQEIKDLGMIAELFVTAELIALTRNGFIKKVNPNNASAQPTYELTEKRWPICEDCKKEFAELANTGEPFKQCRTCRTEENNWLRSMNS